jgi:DNA-binding NarL/FixJ family response regulator
MLNVVLIDDSLVVRRSLGRLFASIPGVAVVGFAEDVSGAIRLIDGTLPDVVVLDVNLHDGGDGIDVLRHVVSRHPRIEVIALSNAVSPPLRAGFLAAGARAYFDKASEFMLARAWIAAKAANAPPASQPARPGLVGGP